MKQRIILYLYAIFYLLLMAGCRDKRYTYSSQQFRSVYNRFDHFNYPKSLFKSLDSVARQNPDLSFADKYDYYTFMCGYYHIAKKDDLKALTYSDSLLLLTTRKNDPANGIDKKAAAYLARGGVLFSLKKYNNALNDLYQSKVSAEHGKNADIKADVYYTMGMVMFKKLSYRQAANYFIQSFAAGSIKQPMPFSKFYRMQEVLNNISESYLMAGIPDSALMYAARVEAFLDKNQSFYKQDQLFEVARAAVEGNAGQAYLLKNDTANGVRLLRSSIASNSRPGYDNGNALRMQLILAQFYLDNEVKKHQHIQAVATLDAVKTGLDSIHDEELQAKWNYLMSRYYDLSHNPATALVYLKQGIDYDKKTNAENKVLSETNVDSYFQALQNEYEMQLLKENNQIEQIYLIISVILSVLCGIIVLLIWRYWHKSKEHVDVLTRLNKKVKRQKKKLEQALVALSARNAEKDHILKVIAHDLRNPISAINALSKLLKDDPTLDKEQNECLDLISTAGVESLELIDAIMQMEDSQQSSVINRKLRNMNEMVFSCVSQLKPLAASKNQNIIIRQSASPQMALIDTDKIQRVVKNLLSNAIKFSHKGSTISVRVTGNEKNIIISICDNGIGIPEWFQDKVFEPFTEARRKGTDDEKTFGLGLSICKQFIEAHGGKIWFKSKENEGSSFYIKLLRKEADDMIGNYSKELISVNETA